MSVLDKHLCMSSMMPRPHTACDTIAFLTQQDVGVMDWQARSSDMNPIEHAWNQMGAMIRDMPDTPFTVPESRRAVLHVWAAVRPRRLRTLVESMPFRVRALPATREDLTRYKQCGGMTVSMIKKFIKIWSYAICFFFHDAII